MGGDDGMCFPFFFYSKIGRVGSVSSTGVRNPFYWDKEECFSRYKDTRDIFGVFFDKKANMHYAFSLEVRKKTQILYA